MKRQRGLNLGVLGALAYLAVCVLAWPLDIWRYLAVVSITFVALALASEGAQR